MSDTAEDARWMGEALALAERSRAQTAPNPNVGCVIVAEGRIVGQGWTQPGGRPHAEAVALAQAGAAAEGATLYVTLEPCAHVSARGPACADLIRAARPARVVVALTDPDPRTNGQGIARLRQAGIAVTEGVCRGEARRSMAGFLTRLALGRPHVTLKLATSLDGRIALPSGESRWITGPEARADVHRERARHEAILVGRGTFEADAPRLDVRLPGLEHRSPRRLLLTRGPAPEGWEALSDVADLGALTGVDHLLVEGGAGAAAAFLAADAVDRLLFYRAPILIGAGTSAIGDLGLASLAEAHGRWRFIEARSLGSDRREVYERERD
ncbi:bifunctional diaminohydroxyphosphoribosylaminopyrimidine deaminase/5-amino-6-(5-phosphoribosylamino)uracil reductase RibD [Sphingomonas desiccabilis]|nr:diaminohydroxyphosphoribosylaminopyrimidine deaminase/5-amino-6-(5-phosphoribosylamino)uracil reductase [Sphingomonas desiccabilis]